MQKPAPRLLVNSDSDGEQDLTLEELRSGGKRQKKKQWVTRPWEQLASDIFALDISSDLLFKFLNEDFIDSWIPLSRGARSTITTTSVGRRLKHHPYISDFFQEFLMTDVLAIDRDLSVFMTTSAYTSKISNYNPDVGQLLVKSIRHDVIESGRAGISAEMFPIRERATTFPYRAFAFVVPSQTYSSEKRETRGTGHFSLLIYYPYENAISLTGDRSLFRFLEESKNSKPRCYHYDSMDGNLNATAAEKLALVLSKYGQLFNSSRQDATVVHMREQQGRGKGTQRAFSCGTWAIAYAEKFQHLALRNNYFSPIPVRVLDRMEDQCTVDITTTGLTLLEYMGEWYQKLVEEPSSEKQLDTIRVRLQQLVTMSRNSSMRLETLARFMQMVYCERRVHRNDIYHPRREYFESLHDGNCHPDFIRMYLETMHCPPDVMVSTDLNRIAGYWAGTQAAIHAEAPMSFQSDPIRTIIWLWLPETSDGNEVYPTLVVFNPLYQTPNPLAKRGFLRPNGFYIYTMDGDAMSEKTVELYQRFNEMIAVDTPESASVAPSFDDGAMLFQFNKKLGRYYVLYVLHRIMHGCSDMPTTQERVIEFQSTVEYTGWNVEMAAAPYSDAGASNVFVYTERDYPRRSSTISSEGFHVHQTTMAKRRMYTRVLKLLAGQESFNNHDPLKPLLLDEKFITGYGKAKVPRVGADTSLNDVPPDWPGETRLQWTKQYFTRSFRFALQDSIQQLTRSLWEGFDQELQRQTPQKLGVGIVRLCPCTIKYAGTPFVMRNWGVLEQLAGVEFVKQWLPRKSDIPSADLTSLYYDSIVLAQVERLSQNWGQDRSVSLYQYPVVFHGHCFTDPGLHTLVMDIWDMVGFMLSQEFREFAATITDPSDPSAASGRTALQAQSPETLQGVDLCARITHHDPYVHIVATPFCAEQKEIIQGLLRSQRENLTQRYPTMTLREFCSNQFGLLERYNNFAVTDIALLCAAYINFLVYKNQ